MLIDSHCHLDLAAFDDDRAAVIERAAAAGIERLVLIGFNPERWRAATELVRTVPGLRLTVGLHPTEAGSFDSQLECSIEDAARELGAVGIGETGMDFHWDTASPAKQRRAFAAQIALAKRLELPVVIHQREAAEEVLAVLAEAGPPHRGVMHCFMEDWDYAERCLAMGLHIGVGGAVTFRKATALHDVVVRLPLDRLLLETDAPFMAPVPFRGRRNEPAYLTYVAQRIAELRDCSIVEIARASTNNADGLFGLGSAGRLSDSDLGDGEGSELGDRARQQ